MKCLVSGATGYVGRAMCARLSVEGVPFVGLSRGGESLANGQSTTALDLASQRVESTLLADIDVVFHLAGIAHQNAQDALYEAVNYRATVDLAAAAAAAGVKIFVFISSVKAMGPAQSCEPRIEEDCIAPMDAYALSKRRAELELQALYEKSEMSVIILRPALIYGESAKGNLSLLARAVRAGLPRPPAAGGRSMVSLEDVVELLYSLLHRPSVGFHTWLVCDGRSYSASEIHDLMRAALGHKPARSWLPLWAWRVGCALRDSVKQAAGASTYEKLFGTELYSAEVLQRELSWQPRLTLEDCIDGIMVTSLKQRETSL